MSYGKQNKSEEKDTDGIVYVDYREIKQRVKDKL